MLKQKTVYFREEDLELWEAVGNKAEFLHNALATKKAYTDLTPKERKHVKEKLLEIPSPLEQLAKIPGVMRASEAKPVTYKQTNNWGA